ncbi:MAG: hypothetical protein Q8L95_08620 [Burkholderiales bacterium]|nr:hypothetical protein [Burkholderiales bacterium]
MRKIIMLTLATTLLGASLSAEARGGHRHTHARVGVFIGAPLLFVPWWVESRPYYYYPPAPVVVRERVIVREPLVYYDERGNPVPAAPQPQSQAQAPAQPQAGTPAPTWFFCQDTQSYYPYVQSCASPWQRVVPQPPPQ